MLFSIVLGVGIAAVYSPERVNTFARKVVVIPGASMDLTNGYGFTKPEDRRIARADMKTTEPVLVSCLPPCTMFSNLQELSQHVHRDDEL